MPHDHVPPDGPLDARIAFVGERPGRDERDEGRGFVGQSGRLLWKLGRTPRGDCYATNVCKDFKDHNETPTRSEVIAALPSLQAELERTHCNLFIALGSTAAFALAGIEALDKWRGSVLESTLLPGRKVLCTYHPAACLRTYQWTYVLERDLRRAAREATYPDIRRPLRTYTLAPRLDEAIAYLRSLGDPISVDIETFGDNPSCVGISDRPDRAICLPFIGGPYTTSELAFIWRELAATLGTRRIIGQNIQFDTTRLERWGFEMPSLWFDTMLAHHLLWPELGGASKRSQSRREGVDALAGKHSLAFLVSIYTDEPYYKDEGGFHGDWTRYWTYNCKDAATTFECYEGLSKELKQYDQLEYFQEHVMGLIRPVMSMQSRGLCVDFGALNKTRARLERETEYLQLSLNKQLGFPCNVKSPDDITKVYAALGVKPTKTTAKRGRASTDEDTLRALAYNSPHAETFQTILDIRERRTLVSGFLGLETNDDGRYAADYLIHGTDSGRLSSRAKRKGPQLQNVPKSARRVFIASPFHQLVQGDLARAEAMFVAYDAEETRLIELFNDPNRDLYSEIARTSLGHEVERRGVERETFKRVVHASNYGMGPHKFLIVLRLQGIDIADITIKGITSPIKKTEYLLETYHAAYPGIRRWQSAIRSQVSRTRTLVDAFGRRRIFLGRMDDSLFRIAYSFKPQATVVGITNRALRLLYERGDFVPLLQVHDSLALEVPIDRIDEGAAALRAAMTYSLQIHGRTMTIPVEIQVGNSWGSLKTWEAPLGLASVVPDVY